MEEILQQLIKQFRTHRHTNFDGTLPIDIPEQISNGRSHGTGVTTVANNTPTKMTPTNDFINEIDWDSANNKFIINTAGQYMISASIGWDIISSSPLYALIYKNGSQYSYGYWSITDILDLNSGDYIELYAQQNTGSSQTVFNDQSTILALTKI